MSAREVDDAIVAAKLYEFHAQNPAHIVLSQIRRHSEGIDFASSAPTKHFQLVGGDRFWTLDSPRRILRRSRAARSAFPLGAERVKSLAPTLRGLQELHRRYIALLKQRISMELRRFSPHAF